MLSKCKSREASMLVSVVVVFLLERITGEFVLVELVGYFFMSTVDITAGTLQMGALRIICHQASTRILDTSTHLSGSCNNANSCSGMPVRFSIGAPPLNSSWVNLSSLKKEALPFL